MANQERVSLADAIAALRSEIRSAAARAQSLPENERYAITEAQIELTVVADDSAEGSVEVGWWILKAKAGIAAKDSITHKVCLKIDVGDVKVGSGQRTQ
ncbi:trypco2 family protein [Paraburkholderia atlantica]|jgi:hypothetical protein|uniref:trypco2 family protein n=1 Tax=Paraburkholderia atlantica TaxID=2654982 RepID=UPI003D1FA2E0